MLKKISLIVLFLMIPGVSFPGWYYSKSSSESCSTPSTGDEFNEGFLGAGYENSWVESAGNPDEDFYLSGSPPSGSCAEGLNINASEALVRTYWNRGSAISYTTTVDIVFSIYFDTIGVTDGSNSIIFAWSSDSGGTNNVGEVRVVLSGSQAALYGRGVGNSTNINISEDTWYTVTLHLDSTAANSYIDVSGTQQAFTRNNYNGQYLHLSATYIGGGEHLDSEIGYIYINTP